MKYLKLSYIQDQKIEKIILAELFWKTFLKCLINLGSIKSVVALKSKLSLQSKTICWDIQWFVNFGSNFDSKILKAKCSSSSR